MPWIDMVGMMHVSVRWARSGVRDANGPVSQVARDYFERSSQIKELGEDFLMTGPGTRTGILAVAMSAWAELDIAGVETDSDRLVQYVCGPNWIEATENCQEAIANVIDQDSSTDQRHWHLLSQFEARPIELGLYDVEPSFGDPDWERWELGIDD